MKKLPVLIVRPNGERRTYFGWLLAADVRTKADPIHWQRSPKLREQPARLAITARSRPDYCVVTVGSDASDELLTRHVRENR
jgi:hypothetical protein